MPIAWALLVVSSEAQAETLKYQRAWAEGVAADKGWHLAHFVEGVSSGKDGPRRLSRDTLVEIRAAPLEARPAHLLIIRLDRIGRGSIVDSQLFVRDLLALGTRLYTRDHGEIRLDSAMDELVAAVQLAVARHENDVRRDKMKSVYKRRLAAGQVISNRSPYGLRLTADRQFEARPEYVDAIRTAFKLRAGGVRMTDVVRWMQEHSEPHRYGNGNEYAVRWSDRRLSTMLQNRAYIGTMVDEATWLRAQRKRIERAIGRSPNCDRIYMDFVLAGILRCVCGKSISGIISYARVKRHRYYCCRAGWTHERATYHRADELEERFLEFLERLVAHPNPPNPARAGDIEKLDHAIRLLRGRIEKIDNGRARIWELDDIGHLEPRDLAERLADLNAQKAASETKLVVAVEERAFLKGHEQRDADAQKIRREAFVRYLSAEPAERTAIGRQVAATFGGLRVTMQGRILVGPCLERVWLRKPHVGELIGKPRRSKC